MENNIYDTIFDDKKLNSLDKDIYLLPDDLKNKIYSDYFKDKLLAQELCNNLLVQLESYDSIKLNYEKLSPFLEKVLKNELAVKNLYENYEYLDIIYNRRINIFKNLYDTIMIDKKKNFEKLNTVNDFALSWLHRLYH